MNRIKLYAISALAGISVTVLPFLAFTQAFNSNAKTVNEHVEPLSYPTVYSATVRSTDAKPDDFALSPVNVGGFSLSAAADKLDPPSGSKHFASAQDNFVYFRQTSPEYNDIPYGDKTIGSYGCGPTNMAVVITSLTGKFVSPVTLARQSEEWYCFVSGSGTGHAFFPKAASYYGLKYINFSYDKQTVLSYLKSGKMIICTMGRGYFSRGGHYVTLRGITEDGNILIADTYSEENTYKEWTLDFLASQLKYNTMWAFYK